MIFLDELAGAGTFVYDKETSASISREHGYLGAPVQFRSSTLDRYAGYSWYQSPRFVQASPGKALVFSPSSCLHRGCNLNYQDKAIPKNSSLRRRVLHLSYAIKRRTDTIDLERFASDWRELLFKTENSPGPPFFVD